MNDENLRENLGTRRIPTAERLLYWQKRAFKEWAFRPGPMWTDLKMLLSDWSTTKTALSVGFQHLTWSATDSGLPIAQ